jgi:hypothetical protein
VFTSFTIRNPTNLTQITRTVQFTKRDIQMRIFNGKNSEVESDPPKITMHHDRGSQKVMYPSGTIYTTVHLDNNEIFTILVVRCLNFNISSLSSSVSIYLLLAQRCPEQEQDRLSASWQQKALTKKKILHLQ